MKITSATQTASRNSNASRIMLQAPLASIAMFTSDEKQVGAMHRRAGNTLFAESILAAIVEVETQGYRLCNVLRDIKQTCNRTLRKVAAH